MANGTRIRKMTPKDIPQIFEIQESITKTKLGRGWITSMERHLKKPDVVGFVAAKSNHAEGFIVAEIMGPGFGLEQSGWIEVVGVYPRSMGLGIGKQLADRLFAYFKSKGIHDIYTAVQWDAVDMLSFFKSIGFDRSEFINLGKHLE
jgi:N-acetylglutamate synthase-like GNAT family acetyltransferase